MLATFRSGDPVLVVIFLSMHQNLSLGIPRRQSADLPFISALNCLGL